MSVPFWRYVRYTDDGSSLYQCLNCYKDWDARTAPGHFGSLVKRYGTGKRTYKDEDGFEYHMVDAEYVYKPYFNFCPCCGIEWEGPVQCDIDNEKMLGPRRLKIQKAIDTYRDKQRPNINWKKGDTKKQEKSSQTWWVIQQREYKTNYQKSTDDNIVMEWSDWVSVHRINPKRAGAYTVKRELNDLRQQVKDDNKDEDEFWRRKIEYRVVIKNSEELCLPPYGGLHEINIYRNHLGEMI